MHYLCVCLLCILILSTLVCYETKPVSESDQFKAIFHKRYSHSLDASDQNFVLDSLSKTLDTLNNPSGSVLDKTLMVSLENFIFSFSNNFAVYKEIHNIRRAIGGISGNFDQFKVITANLVEVNKNFDKLFLVLDRLSLLDGISDHAHNISLNIHGIRGIL
uniref:Uncharacterized protein n=1 Tax=Saiwaicho virus TaxID=2170594 RepID=A0A2S0S4Q5_9VIRU|nr:hypothetical protein [Saiwaicho virus]